MEPVKAGTIASANSDGFGARAKYDNTLNTLDIPIPVYVTLFGSGSLEDPLRPLMIQADSVAIFIFYLNIIIVKAHNGDKSK